MLWVPGQYSRLLDFSLIAVVKQNIVIYVRGVMIVRNISIVNMRLLPAIILGASMAGCGGGGSNTSLVAPPPAGSFIITLTAPTTREDGKGLSLSEIAGYRVYYGTASGDYHSQVELPPVANQTFNFADLDLNSGRYFAVVTTVDVDGRESLYSDEMFDDI